MNYLYESLNDQSFQQLCQSLIVQDFKSARCLPIGQPDGGRDAFTRQAEGAELDVVFQVKFTLDPLSKEARDVVESTIKTELHKVKNLVGRGMKRYILITNVRGSSHLDSGSVDRLEELLSEGLGIESQIWWRDDLDARISANYNIKLSFPAILRGTDIIQALICGDSCAKTSARRDAVRAYVAFQYEKEQLVKFTQVDLENNILDLFTDPALSFEDLASLKSGEIQAAHQINRSVLSEIKRLCGDLSDSSSATASQYFLSDVSRTVTPSTIILGGPGQGKSTVTQFLAQVNRIKILDISSEIDKLSPYHKLCSVRLPFKVDLRDYATWVQGLDPFSRDRDNKDKVDKPAALESFLATQVSTLSGGYEFGVADLSEILKETPSTIILDGFDEIADVSLRNEVVEQVSSAAKRLFSVCKNVQMLVTSRPTAFSEAKTFSREHWGYISISDLQEPAIVEYVDRWLRCRKADRAEIDEFKAIVASRIKEPHVKELSRNAMQLAILLTMLKSKGDALPDKRTDLYRSYLEYFLDRESGKWPLVKKYREDILELHGYIAWILQTRAEAKRSDGRVSSVEFRAIIEDYWRSQQYDATELSGLITSMTQRIVAIVSRVEGTYEFEVQPLREYFAARYLYTTARYSPIGREVGGTLTDRLAAIAPRPYWNNTVRFYAGFYSKGEAPSLHAVLSEQIAKDRSGYLRALAVRLIGDWVLNQSIPSLNALLTASLAEPGVRALWAQSYGPDAAVVTLSERGGRALFATELRQLLAKSPFSDERTVIADWLSANTSMDQRLAIWRDDELYSAPDALHIANSFEIIGSGPADAIQLIDNLDSSGCLEWLMVFGRSDVLTRSVEAFNNVCDYYIDGARFSYFPPKIDADISDEMLTILAFVTSEETFRVPISWAEATEVAVTLEQYWRSMTPAPDEWPLGHDGCTDSEVGIKIANALSVIREQGALSVYKWRGSLDPWVKVSATLHALKPYCWASIRLAAMAVRAQAAIEVGEVFDIYAEGVPLPRAAAVAFSMRDEPSWWSIHLAAANECWRARFILFLLFTIADESVIPLVSEQAAECMSLLEPVRRHELISFVRGNSRLIDDNENIQAFEVKGLDEYFLAALLYGRSGDRLKEAIFKEIECRDIDDHDLASIYLEFAIAAANNGEVAWSSVINIIRKNFLQHPNAGIYWIEPIENENMPIEVAQVVLSQVESYPLSVVYAATSAVSAKQAETYNDIERVATEDEWFEVDDLTRLTAH